MLSHADDRVGELLDTLDRLKIADNTLVIFSSDNEYTRAAKPTELTLHYDTATGAGWGIGGAKGITGGRKGYKAAIFEGGIGVPFIARWPGKIAAGKEDKVSLISAVDLLPTFCELAGACCPQTISRMESVLWRCSRGNRCPPVRNPSFGNQSPPGQPSRSAECWVSWAVVEDQWKLVANKDLTHVELYDIAKDVAEANNVKDKQPKVAERLVGRIKEWQATLPEKPTGNVFSGLRKDIPKGK